MRTRCLRDNGAMVLAYAAARGLSGGVLIVIIVCRRTHHRLRDARALLRARILHAQYSRVPRARGVHACCAARDVPARRCLMTTIAAAHYRRVRDMIPTRDFTPLLR